MKNLGGATIDALPEVCPQCHHSILAILLEKSITVGGVRDMQAVFRCPRASCNSLFIAYYRSAANGDGYRFEGTLPWKHKAPDVHANVAKLSPAFVEIYGQAVTAKSHGLDQIYGMALRKALEFLIKDYCVSRVPNEKEAIQKLSLYQCIETKIVDAKIKECAKMATWLGNDEVHYIRKWTDHDITDLQTLILLTSNSIDNELLMEKYMKSMPDSKNKAPTK